MTSIAAGTYDIRYRALDNGHLAKSDPIHLQQVEEADGTKFSVVRLTLYRVVDGNMEFVPLGEDQF